VTTLVWLRHDLRLNDNPALLAAARMGAVVPVFVWAPAEEGDWPPGAASRWWLDRSLRALDAALRARGSRLIVRRGPSVETLAALTAEVGAGGVYWNRRYEPAVIARDAQATRVLAGVRTFNAGLLHEPWTVRTRGDGPFRVFTPFWKAISALGEPEAPAPIEALPAPAVWPGSLAIDDLGLRPLSDWDAEMRAAWSPGEAGAVDELDRFLDHVERYADTRDTPSVSSSRLSPHLHFGEIGPRQIWAAVRERAEVSATAYLRQLGWREFAHHLLYHFPNTPDRPLHPAFNDFPWRDDPTGLRSWQQGQTGHDFVDAGMCELWRTGWIHNRVRMVAASFLVKDLLIDWREGARWFWDTLVDADLANNTLGWQWVAGCGADSAPFFRIFNPAVQAARFDPERRYRDQWLKGTRPAEIVSHPAARRRALEAYAQMRNKSRAEI
jgi:deoxyribodipyrimidine photo-lyase